MCQLDKDQSLLVEEKTIVPFKVKEIMKKVRKFAGEGKGLPYATDLLRVS